MAYRHPRFTDDTEIDGDSQLWRKVNLNVKRPVVRDERHGYIRPSSSAFIFSKETISFSVLLKDIVEASSRGPEDVIDENWALVSLFVSDVREDDLGVAKTDGDDVAHADVFDKLDRTRSQRNLVQERLAHKAKWVLEPPKLPDAED